MNSIKKKRKLYLVTVALALVFIVGAVYAAASGTLSITGTVVLGAEVDVSIEGLDEEWGDVANKEGTWGTFTVAPDGKSAEVEGKITEPGDDGALYFMYMIENNGPTNVEVVLEASTSADLPLVISGGHEDDFAGGETIYAGGASLPKTLTVTWESGIDDTAEGDFSFTIDLLATVTN